MKAREMVIGARANMRRKGSHCAGIAGFQPRKRIKIALCRGIFVLLGLERLERAQCLRPAPQNKIADRPASKFLRSRSERCTDAYAGAELLVGSLKTRRDVDGIAISRVVEKSGRRQNFRRSPDRHERRCG